MSDDNNGISVKELKERIFDADESFYNKMLPYYESYSRGDKSALGPESVADSILSEMTRLLKSQIAVDKTEEFLDSLPQEKEQLDFEDKPMSKTERLKLIATLAESQIENYYAKKAYKRIEQLAAARSMTGSRPIKESEKIRVLNDALKDYPWLKFYETLTKSEIGLLTTAHAGSLPETLHSQMAQDRPNDLYLNGFKDLKDRTITFPGSGPMPLTAIFMHVYSGAKANLVEIDKDAAKKSKRLIENLETLGVLEKGALKVYHADAARVHYVDSKSFKGETTNLPNGKELALPTDILFVAVMVPNEAKAEIMKDVNASSSPPEAIISRTAHGLAKLRYRGLEPHEVETPNIGFHAESAQERHITTPDFKGSVQEYSVPIRMDDEIVHSTQMYFTHKLPLLNRHFVPKDETSQRVQSFVNQLEQEAKTPDVNKDNSVSL